MSAVGRADAKSTHCSLIGTTRYFLLNTSTLDVHFRTLSYPAFLLVHNSYKLVSDGPPKAAAQYSLLDRQLLVEE